MRGFFFFHTYSWTCVNQVLEFQRNISSAVFQPCLWLVLTLVSPQSLLCSFPGTNNYHTNNFICNVVFFQIQSSFNIMVTSVLSVQRREAVNFSLEGGQRLKVPLLLWSSSKILFALCQILMAKLWFFAIGISPVFQKCPWMLIFKFTLCISRLNKLSRSLIFDGFVPDVGVRTEKVKS